MNQPPPPILSGNPYASPTVVEPVAPPQAPEGPAQFVLAGGRFYVIPYNFSVVVLSFRRSMGGVLQVSSDNWPMGKAITAAIISCCLGWWGFPIGCLVFTPLTLFQLWNGGEDVTRKVLTRFYSPGDVAQILARAPKPKKPGSIWIVRGIILVPVLLIAFVIFKLATAHTVPPYHR